MNKNCEYVLKLFCDHLEGNSDGYIPSIDIGNSLKEERKEIMMILEKNGCVTNISYNGHSSVGCCVTNKGRNYFD